MNSSMLATSQTLLLLTLLNVSLSENSALQPGLHDEIRSSVSKGCFLEGAEASQEAEKHNEVGRDRVRNRRARCAKSLHLSKVGKIEII